MTRSTRLSRLLALLIAAVALAGCSDDGGGADDGDAMDGGDGTAGGDGMAGGATGSAGGSGGSGSGSGSDDVEAEPPIRFENITMAQALADCTVVAAAVSNGLPVEPLALGATTVSLSAEDWDRSWSVELVGDAASGAAGQSFPLTKICVGFAGVGSMSSGTNGFIPMDATEMVIGGDFVYEGAIEVVIGA